MSGASVQCSVQWWDHGTTRTQDVVIMPRLHSVTVTSIWSRNVPAPAPAQLTNCGAQHLVKIHHPPGRSSSSQLARCSLCPVSSAVPSSVWFSFPECGGRFRSTFCRYHILYSPIRSRNRRLLRSFDRVTRQLQMDNIAGHLVNWGIWNFLYLESTILTMSHST